MRIYAPSRHGGRVPCITWHSVGGSSSTGAKLSDKTCLGSTAGLFGGSMKLFMMSSNALKIVVERDGAGGGAVGAVAVGFAGIGF